MVSLAMHQHMHTCDTDCRHSADNATNHIRSIALDQLNLLMPNALHRSWNLGSFFDRVFVISLAKHSERRRRLNATLRTHGTNSIEFIEAVDGALVLRDNPQKWERRLFTDEIDPLPSPAGAIGCYLSHFVVHRRARVLRLRTYLVLEDDAVLLPRGGKKFRQAMSQVPNNWEAVYLGYNKAFSEANDCTRTSSSQHHGVESGRATCPCADAEHVALCRARSGLLNTHAIAYHQRALEWLLPLLSRSEEGSTTRLMPVDIEMRMYLERHAPSTSVHAVLKSPVVAQNRSFASDIYVKGMYEGGRAYLRDRRVG